MASGTPDYALKTKTDITAIDVATIAIDIAAQTISNINIDVNAQSLSEIVNRPKYGAMQVADYNVADVAPGDTTMHNISAQGVIYGGFFYTYASTLHKADAIEITIDGTQLFILNYGQLLSFGFGNNTPGLFTLNKYDDVGYYYALGLNGPITFESTVLTEYHNSYVDDNGVRAQLFYATI